MSTDSDRRYLWHPYAPVVNPPPVFEAAGGSGARVRLADGVELIDAVSSWWCMAHGHNHPAITSAIREQCDKLTHVMFAGFTHAPAMELAEELRQRLPAGLKHIFFADSGSIAVECAVKMAVQYQMARKLPAKSKLAAHGGGYHGDTIGAMSLSDPNGMHTMFKGLLPKHFFAPMPAVPFDGEWRDEAFAPMQKLLDEHADEIAAVIIEPIFQGANAMRFYHPQYLKKLRAACDAHDVLLIFDEIATGFGRVGRRFAQEYAGVTPDIMCIGKILSGGAVTLAAAVASEQVGEVISEGGRGAFLHGPTYMANPIACAASCASLRLLDQYDWQSRVNAIESRLKDGLAPARAIAGVRDVRVLGATGVIEVAQMPSPQVVRRIVLKHHVWLRPFGNWLYTMPPFICTPDEIDAISETMLDLAAEAAQ
ncbi:MAG: adenosylmethionine--8-amino-7-oxononanoate transaminase [Victivallaceae bacterium]|nr:adenosylmethionine--8-amino-7-oxononanoate transaminase [Victivallaceae bacterium]